MSDSNFAAHVLKHAFERYTKAIRDYQASERSSDSKTYAFGVLSEAIHMLDWLEEEIRQLLTEGDKLVEKERENAVESSVNDKY